MALPESYILKPAALPAYFDAMLDAEAPERFSQKFLENLGFTSTNDRLLIGVLKSLGFLNSDGAPQQRYFEFLDRTRAKQVLAEAIRDAYEELFAINKKANELNKDEVKNKLRTLYAGKKSDDLTDRIARTFTALCEYADFITKSPSESVHTDASQQKSEAAASLEKLEPKVTLTPAHKRNTSLSISGLQYHISIVLPDSRDPAVYDAIFKSLKDHLS